MALQVFAKDQILPEETINGMILKFVAEHMSAARPFYYHTDVEKTQRLFKAMAPILGYEPSSFPYTAPVSFAANWLDTFILPEHQGCGHLRLSLQRPQEYGYKDSKLLGKVIKAYIRAYWGFTTYQKESMYFSVKLGPLSGTNIFCSHSVGKAISIVKTVGDKCGHLSPKVFANTRGSSSFIYTPDAIDDFREDVLVKFFKSYDSSIDTTTFLSQLHQMGNLQLNVTLGPTGLTNANQVNIFEVLISLSAADDYAKMLAIVIGSSVGGGIGMCVLIALCVAVGCCLPKTGFKKKKNNNDVSLLDHESERL